MILQALKILMLVNASIALGFALFVQLVKLCAVIGVSPWWVAVAYVALYVWWWVGQCRRAQHG